MKKIIVLTFVLFTSISAFCQKCANIYAPKISSLFSDGAKLKLDTIGRLVLYNGNSHIQLYIERWTPSDERFVYVGDKLVNLKKLGLGSTDYCILKKDEEVYTLFIRGEKAREFRVFLSSQAKIYFDKYASPSHAAHSSHYSSFHASHYSSY